MEDDDSQLRNEYEIDRELHSIIFPQLENFVPNNNVYTEVSYVCKPKKFGSFYFFQP